MRKFSLLIIFGAAILFFGCQKENQVVPGQGDETVPALKAQKIYFEGQCLPTPTGVTACGVSHEMPNGNIKVTGFQSVWYDDTNDPLTTGHTYWNEDMIIWGDGKSSKAWGKATLVLDDGRGEWAFSLQGYSYIKEGSEDILVPICDMPPPPAPLPSAMIIGVCKGVGKSGDVKGMVGEWTYVMDMDAGLFYNIEGWYH